MGEYTGKGQGALNTVLGALGTAGFLGMGANGDCNGGGLLNLNSRNNCYVSQEAFNWAQAAASEKSRADKLEAEKETDAKILDTYKAITAERKEVDAAQNEGFRFLNEKISAQGEEIAVLKSDIRCLSVLNEEQHKAIATKAASDVQLESERRVCSDETILTYVNSNYIKGVTKLSADDICPQVQLKCEEPQLVQVVSTK